jgi:hypothetical protein
MDPGHEQLESQTFEANINERSHEVNDLGEVTWLITRHLELDQMEIEGLNIGLGKFLGG